MIKIKSPKFFLIVLILFGFSLTLSGCGTSHSVKQPFGADMPLGNTVYVVLDCISEDTRATEETCKILQEQVRYGLFKYGLYEDDQNPAQHEVYLTITNYRNVGAWTRAWFGVLSGKDGIDVNLEVVDRQSRNPVGSAKISYYNVTAVNSTETMMIYQVRKKIVGFLVTGEFK